MQIGMIRLATQGLSCRGDADLTDRLFSAMRYEFGGHLERAHRRSA
jgi:6-phosphogluconate dehydrogenase (decarboxylating)